MLRVIIVALSSVFVPLLVLGSASGMPADANNHLKKHWGGPGGLVQPLVPEEMKAPLSSDGAGDYVYDEGQCYSATYDCGIDDGSTYVDGKTFNSSTGTSCQTRHALRRRRNLAYVVVYTYYQQVRWCWKGGKVTYHFRDRWPGGTNLGWSFKGNVWTNCGPQDAEHCSGKVGEASEWAATKGQFQVCLGVIGISVCRDKFPRIDIYTYGNGTSSASTSG